MSKPLPLPEALREIRRKLYAQHDEDQFTKLLARDLKVSADSVRRWVRGANYPQPAALRQLKVLAARAGIEIAGSPESFSEVTLPIRGAIDAISARIPMSYDEMARQCRVKRPTLSHWRGRNILPGDNDVRERLRRLAARANVRIEGL